MNDVINCYGNRILIPRRKSTWVGIYLLLGGIYLLLGGNLLATWVHNKVKLMQWHSIPKVNKILSNSEIFTQKFIKNRYSYQVLKYMYSCDTNFVLFFFRWNKKAYFVICHNFFLVKSSNFYAPLKQCFEWFMTVHTGRKINFFSGSHLAPKYFEVVANS